MMHLSRTCSLALLLASVGCGSEVLVLGPPGDPDPGTGAGGAVPVPTTVSVGGNEPPEPPEPPPPVCPGNDDRFQMAFYAADGSLWGCDAGEKSDEGSTVVDGEVVAVDEVSILIDSCPPGSTCPQDTLSLLEFNAAGLIHETPVGAFVRIAVAVEEPMGCAHELMVRNLPSWLSVPNPIDTTERIWLAGADGTLGFGAFESVKVSLTEPSCDPDLLTNARALELDWGVGSMVLEMGEELVADDIALRNLRSYAPALDTHEVGYWFSQP